MKPDDLKSSTYISCNVENNDEDFKFEPVDHVRISIYKKILQMVSLQIDLKKVLWLK